MNAQIKTGWADRLSPTMRTVLIIVMVFVGMLAVGMVGGFTYAVLEDGEIPTKPMVYIVFAIMIGLVLLSGWTLLRLVRASHPERMSRFDRRYWKMWAWLIGLSLPIGAALAIFGISDQSDGFSLILSNAPIAPLTAIVVAIGIGILLVASVVVYFRVIDDHERQAYLWGSNVAFHFLALAFPLYWLLARGGLVPTLTIGIALLIVLLSCIVQSLVWALFKFR